MDINKALEPQDSWPNPKHVQGNNHQDDKRFVQLGSTAYFSASAITTGYELYASPGIGAGGRLVMDINPGAASSSPANFTRVGNKIYFMANDGKNGSELWVTSGTKASTRLVADLNPGTSSSNPNLMSPLGNSGKFVFRAFTAATGSELYISDGTAAGTKLLKDIAPGSRDSSPSYMKSFNDGKRDIVLFSAWTANVGAELWVTDGTTAGTIMLKDIRPGAGGSEPRFFQTMGKKLIFSAINIFQGTELWTTDGTTAGTKHLKLISRRPGYPAILYFSVFVRGKYYFEGWDVVNGSECWVTDGTAAGTKLFSDSYPRYRSGYFRWGVAFGTKIIYAGYGVSGDEPWILDTITGQAKLLKDLWNGFYFPTTLGPFEVLGKRVVFRARSKSSGTELFVTDGTTAGTKLLKDIYPGYSSSNPAYMTRLSTGRMIFSATTPKDKRWTNNLWVTDGTTKGTFKVPVVQQNAPTADSKPAYATPVNGSLYFAADNGVNGTELWKSDGSAAGTVLVADIFPGSNSQGAPNSSTPGFLARVGNDFVFAAADGKGKGRELWISDGTAAGSRLMKDILPGAGSSDPGHMSRVGNKVYFAAKGYDRATPRNYVGKELFVTNGTPTGTRFLADIAPGSLSSNPRGFTEIGNTGKFVFSATGFTTKAPITSIGYELYISDGTTAGTRILKDINPGSASSFPTEFEAMGNKVYFQAISPTTGIELWVTDGTANGTTIVKDIASGRSSAYPRFLQASGGKLFFQALTSSGSVSIGYELWVSDGTASGTRLFKDLPSPAWGSYPSYMTAAGSRHLWFSADYTVGSTSLGHELWTSDLTQAGTRPHTDLWPGPRSGSPSGYTFPKSQFAVMGSKVFFVAWSAAHGGELWLVDNGATATRFGDACKSSFMSGTDPVLGGTAKITGTTKIGFSTNIVLLGIRSTTALAMGGECQLHLNPLGPILIVGTSTGTSYTAALPIPNMPRLMGLHMALQTLHLGSSFPGGSGFSNGLEWVVGK